jgi:glycosyltransferase involved in cell wall biosynthesis
VEHAPDDTAALGSAEVEVAELRRLEAENERLRVRLAELESSAAGHERFLRLIREAEHVPAPSQTIDPRELRILELERDLTLASLSRLYRLGKTVRRVQKRLAALRPRRPVDVEPERLEPLDVQGLPGGSARRPVVFFVPWLLHGGGGERFVSDLARGLVADGRAVAVVVTAGTPVEMLDATADMLEVTPHVFDLPRTLDEPDRLAFCEQLLARSEAPVVVNVGSEWFYEHVDALKAVGRGVRIVDTLFNHVGHIRNNVARAPAIDTTVAAHQALERLLVDYYGVPNDVRTVYVGVDSRGPAPRRARDGTPVVGWLGRLSGEKRPAWFVELARRLGGTARFRLAGDGPDGPRIAAAARDVPALEVLGFVDDNIGFIDGCDLIVITSEVEGISIVAMEAISRGVPVISTDVGGMPDLIRPGVHGDLVSAGEFEALVERVRALIGDEQSLRELQERVRSSGLAEEFTCATMLARFRKILA